MWIDYNSDKAEDIAARIKVFIYRVADVGVNLDVDAAIDLSVDGNDETPD